MNENHRLIVNTLYRDETGAPTELAWLDLASHALPPEERAWLRAYVIEHPECLATLIESLPPTDPTSDWEARARAIETEVFGRPIGQPVPAWQSAQWVGFKWAAEFARGVWDELVGQGQEMLAAWQATPASAMRGSTATEWQDLEDALLAELDKFRRAGVAPSALDDLRRMVQDLTRCGRNGTPLPRPLEATAPLLSRALAPAGLGRTEAEELWQTLHRRLNDVG